MQSHEDLEEFSKVNFLSCQWTCTALFKQERQISFSKIITLEKYETLEEQVTTRLKSQSQLFELKISSEFILG